MRSVWLENILLHQPKRWLPEKYPNYDELLAAAVEAAVNDAQAPKELASWRWGAQNAVHIQHLVLGKIPVIRRWSGPGVQEQSGSGYTVKAVSAHHGPSERFTRQSGRPGSFHAECRHRAVGKLLEPLLHGSVESVVRRNHVHVTVQRTGGPSRESSHPAA